MSLWTHHFTSQFGLVCLIGDRGTAIKQLKALLRGSDEMTWGKDVASACHAVRTQGMLILSFPSA